MAFSNFCGSKKSVDFPWERLVSLWNSSLELHWERFGYCLELPLEWDMNYIGIALKAALECVWKLIGIIWLVLRSALELDYHMANT